MAKTLHYDFLTNPTLTGSEHPIATTPDLSITRATKATMVDADGYIREVQAGEARFTGATWGHNIWLQSEDLSTTWLNTNTTETTNATTDPNGGSTADKLVEASDVAQTHGIYQSFTTASGKQYTFSIYAKAAERSEIRLDFSAAGFTNNIKKWYNLGTGTLGSNGPVAPDAASITDVGGGWCRISITATADEVAAAQVFIYMGSGSETVTYNGDGSSGLYLWGAQLEIVDGRASTDPNTYIPTTTVAKTSLTGTSTKGLLKEEARTQLLASTEAFSASPWFTSAAAIDNNAATSPSGATDADRFKDNSAGGSGNPRILQSLTVSASTEYVYSVFAKADGESWIRLFVANMGALVPSAYFNLSAGTIGTTSADVDDATIEDYGNGWYRVSIAFTSDATDTSITAYMGVADGDGDDTVALDGTSSVFIWGAMFEAGSGYPSSYISNTATSGTVTRNADQVSTTDMSWWNDVEGTIYCEASLNGVFQSPSATGQNYIYSIDDGTENNRVIQWINQGALPTAGSAIVRVASGGTTQAQPTDARSSGVYAVGTATKTALGIKENDFAFYLDGSEAALGSPDTSGSMPAVSPTKLNIGQRLTANFQTGGHIAEIAYFNERLANATLEDYSLNGLPTAFPGTVAGDGGHIWPARSNDPRWAQIITDSGITPSGNFIDDVHAALEAMASTTGAMDDLWKKVKAVYSITDTSEPFTY